jgi:stearoyl-CoA desaturase (delta-9 desaturase)
MGIYVASCPTFFRVKRYSRRLKVLQWCAAGEGRRFFSAANGREHRATRKRSKMRSPSESRFPHLLRARAWARRGKNHIASHNGHLQMVKSFVAPTPNVKRSTRLHVFAERRMNELNGRPPPRNWAALSMFAITLGIALTLVPWYGITRGYTPAGWIAFAVLLSVTELSITCGYHRLFSHAAYQAHPALKAVFLLFGAMALQNSALNWSAGHRVHHRFIDDPERDPYCARRGFWFSHIGWMLRNYPSGDPDLKYVRELQKDPLVSFQHRHYLPLAMGMNFGVPLLLGWAFGNIVGMLLLAGILRLVISHHLTFCINSLAHIVGTRPYSTANSARDNAVVAMLTFGEGYHNFHHQFAHDYRNGVRWWQWDPSKWLINALHWVGLAKNLKRVPRFKIRRAMLENQFLRATQALARQVDSPRFNELRQRVAGEYESFSKSVAAWTALREQSIADAKRALVDRWEKSNLSAKLKALEDGLHDQYRRMQLIVGQMGTMRI